MIVWAAITARLSPCLLHLPSLRENPKLNSYSLAAKMLFALNYNVTVRSFPSNLTAMVFGYKEKPSFTVENEKEIAKPPAINFDKPAASGAAK